MKSSRVGQKSPYKQKTYITCNKYIYYTLYFPFQMNIWYHVKKNVKYCEKYCRIISSNCGDLIQVLEEVGVLKRIKRCAGTSSGSLVALMITLGYTSEEIRKVARMDFRDFYGLWSPFKVPLGFFLRAVFCEECHVYHFKKMWNSYYFQLFA